MYRELLQGFQLTFVILSLAALLICTSFYFSLRDIYQREMPCSRPIPYSIGTIDPRFNLDKKTLAGKLHYATSTWNKAYGKTLFTAADAGGLQVHFVYDERQQLIEQGLALEEEWQNIEDAKEVLQKKETYLIARGKLTRKDFDWMNKENRDLLEREKQFEQKDGALTAKMEQYDTAAEYVFATNNKHINVYMFWNDEDLSSLLTHEFGHALLLDHIKSPDSVMNAATRHTLPSKEDIRALSKVCAMDFWTFLKRRREMVPL